MNISTENLEWLEKFKKKYGRKPKVLHIGNIANNAYINAKILNESGVESDVICYDYYHIMGCPEWEDADFEGDYENDFQPQWRKVNLRSFERPEWFAQGPMDLCLRYLVAKNNKNKIKSFLYRFSLKHSSYGNKFFRNFFKALFSRGKYSILQKMKFEVLFFVALCGILIMKYEFMRNVLDYLASIPSYFLFSLLLLLSILIKLKLKLKKKKEENSILHPDIRITLWGNIELEKSILNNYLSRLPVMKKLFSSYDFIIGYSTDGIYPLLAGVKYFAFSHGTIRDIPFKDDLQGRLCALTYKYADEVFVTNSDCLQKAEQLACKSFSFINHPFEENHSEGLIGYKELREHLKIELDADYLCFFPTRHDWIEGKGYADKKNEVFLEALIQLRNKGLKVGVVCCEWGNNVLESKQMLKEAGCESYVSWYKPMGTVLFERMCLATDFLIDQFKLGAFGGILFKSLATGVTAITYLNEDEILKHYDEIPPIINCRTTDEIVDGIIRHSQTVNSSECFREKSKKWIKKYHNSEDLVNIQLEKFRNAGVI